jgi:Lar family restriction alleviation protein
MWRENKTMFDEKCKHHDECGYDFCHGEGVCEDFRGKGKLLPCPFCGYDVVLEGMKVRKGYEVVVHCNGCLASIHTITYDTEEEAEQNAIQAWNRRAT